MRNRGYSLVEVMVAAAVVAVGLTAAAVLVGTIMRQQEINAGTLRAANLHEQAVALFRLGMGTNATELLPESGYSFSFGGAQTNSFTVDGTRVDVEVTLCTMTYPNPSGEGPALGHTVRVVRPTIRAD